MTAPLDPATVIAEFIDRVAHYDPSPDADPVAAVGVRTAYGEAMFRMSDHVVRAMCRARVRSEIQRTLPGTFGAVAHRTVACWSCAHILGRGAAGD